MSHKHTHGLPYCQNCHYPLAEMDKFCPNCGQQNTDGKITMHDLWHEVTHYFTHVDNKIFVTIRHLFIPGKLTDEFLKGHRKRYIHPINLFFVVGIILPFILGQFWKNIAKEGDINKGFLKEQTVYRNDLLFEMDSIAKRDSLLSSDYKRAIDTFLLKNYQRYNVNFSKKDTSLKGLTTQYYLIKDKMKHERQAINLLHDTLQIDKKTDNAPLIRLRLSEAEAYFSKLTYDSSVTLSKIAQLDGEAFDKTIKSLERGYAAYQMGKKWGLKTPPPVLTIDSILKYPTQYDPVQEKLDSRHNIIKRDSITIGFLTGQNVKLDEIDIYTLNNEAIFDKYKIDGFGEKIAVKQFIQLGKEGINPLMAGYSKNFVVNTMLSIIPCAWCFLLLFRRPKRLFVEHVIFLIHYSCFTFIASALLLLKHEWYLYLSIVLCLLFLIVAVKRVYKQTWLKSILKGTLMYVINIIWGTLITSIGMVVSVILS
jgi:hypothetical protein